MKPGITMLILNKDDLKLVTECTCLLGHPVQTNRVQYNTVQYNTVRYTIVQENEVKYTTVKVSTVE